MATSLLDWIMDLMRNSEAREEFNANPQAAMASAGFTNVCGQDIVDSRAFLFDNPNIREVAGVDLPRGDKDVREVAGVDLAPDADAPDQIRFIVNNYMFEAPDVPDIDDGDGPEFEDIEDSTITTTDDDTVTATDDSTEVEASDDGNDFEGDNSAGEDRVSDNSAGDDRISDGSAGEDRISNGSAGEDMVSESVLGDVEDGFNQDNDALVGLNNVLNLEDTLDTGDVSLLSDLVNDSLNDSPILTDLLDDSLNGSLNDAATNVLQDGLIPIL